MSTGQSRLAMLLGTADGVQVAEVAVLQDRLDLGGRSLRRRVPAAAHAPQHAEDLRFGPLALPSSIAPTGRPLLAADHEQLADRATLLASLPSRHAHLHGALGA